MEGAVIEIPWKVSGVSVLSLRHMQERYKIKVVLAGVLEIIYR